MIRYTAQRVPSGLDYWIVATVDRDGQYLIEEGLTRFEARWNARLLNKNRAPLPGPPESLRCLRRPRQLEMFGGCSA